jgi:hypothetical protein
MLLDGETAWDIIHDRIRSYEQSDEEIPERLKNAKRYADQWLEAGRPWGRQHSHLMILVAFAIVVYRLETVAAVNMMMGIDNYRIDYGVQLSLRECDFVAGLLPAWNGSSDELIDMARFLAQEGDESGGKHRSYTEIAQAPSKP